MQYNVCFSMPVTKCIEIKMKLRNQLNSEFKYCQSLFRNISGEQSNSKKIIALLYANLGTNTVYNKKEFCFVDRTNIHDIVDRWGNILLVYFSCTLIT